MSVNIFLGIIDFMEKLFNGALSIWEFMTSPINVLGLSFNLLDIFLGGLLAVLIVAWLVKKVVPLV